jgi:hypothetical protein
MGQRRRHYSEKFTQAKSSRKQHSPSGHYINAPDEDARNHPNNRDSNKHRFFEEEPNRKQKVSDVAHPKRVSKLMNMPVVNSLCSEEPERENAQEAKFSRS